MCIFSKEKLEEFILTASTLKNDIHACLGGEIENEGLAARMYRLYIASDILSGAKARKGAEEKLTTARLYTNRTLELYYKTIRAKGISTPLSYMERAFSKSQYAHLLAKQAA